MNKDCLRLKYKNIRQHIQNKKSKESDIINNIVSTNFFKEANIIALYSSINSEVDTSNLFVECLRHHKTVCFPRCNDDKTMSFYKVRSISDLTLGHFNILEPIPLKENLIKPQDINLMIIPGLCFDKFKNRVGYGQGYYDRYLKNTSILKVALCFEDQLLTEDIIEASPNDIKVDFIITEKNIY